MPPQVTRAETVSFSHSVREQEGRAKGGEAQRKERSKGRKRGGERSEKGMGEKREGIKGKM